MNIEECPLCGRQCHSADHTRQHMHTHHLKSEIIDAYIREQMTKLRETEVIVAE